MWEVETQIYSKGSGLIVENIKFLLYKIKVLSNKTIKMVGNNTISIHVEFKILKIYITLELYYHLTI